MPSEKSSKAGLGTAIALIGGAVGFSIIIYALLGSPVEEPTSAGVADNGAVSLGSGAATVQSSVSDTAQETPVQGASEAPVVQTETSPPPQTEPQGLDAEETATVAVETAPTPSPVTAAGTDTEQETVAEVAAPLTEEEAPDVASEAQEAPSETVQAIAADNEQPETDKAQEAPASAPEEDAVASPPTESADSAQASTAQDSTQLAAVQPDENASPSEDTPAREAEAEVEVEVEAEVQVPEERDGTSSAAQDTTGEQDAEVAETTDVASAPDVKATDPVAPGTAPIVLDANDASEPAEPELDANDPSVPKFDLVRIEADGSAVIAGRAAPDAEVAILSNGEEIGRAQASSRGEFVALLNTDSDGGAQSLALVATDEDGGKVSSQSNVIVLARAPVENATDEEISLPPAIVQSTPDEVKVLQPVIGLADLDRVSLDSISYDEAGRVVLAGRGRPGNVARVYANGTSLEESSISESGTWSAELTSLDVGRYVIRVDEISPAGEVLSRVESPFQRIFPTAEQLALLTDASSVIVQPGNNLWTIAERKYGEGFRYTTIFEANKEQIRDPDLIYPGQVFDLPDN